MARVHVKGFQWVHIEPLKAHGGIMLHPAIMNGRPVTGEFTVSHERTGLALFSNQTQAVAEHFFREACDWPEWGHITSKADAQFLKPRIEALRREALEYL